MIERKKAFKTRPLCYFLIKRMTSLVLDLSYVIFYRFYALRAYKKISKRSDFELNTEDEIFRTTFRKAFVDMIIKLVRKHRPNRLIFAIDCMRCDIWRREVMQEYKNRQNLSDFDSRVFPLTINEIIPEVINKMNNFTISRKSHPVSVNIMKHDSCEADDLVYIYCKHIAPEKLKIIITGDNDYLQLLDDKTEIYCLKGKSLRLKSTGCCETDLLQKVIGGDPSDNIPKLLSKNALSQLFKDKSTEEIFEKFKDDEAFNRNLEMVDMRCIPSNLVQSVVEKFDADEI